MKIAYVGFTSEALPNVDEYIALPKAPSNYKDLDKIKAYIDAAIVKKREEAKNSLLTGKLKEATVIITDSEAESSQTTYSDSNEKGIRNLYSLLPDLTACDIIAGHKIFDLLDLAILARIEAKKALLEDFHWAKLSSIVKRPYLLPGIDGRRIIFDPIDALGGTDAVDNPLMLVRRWKFNLSLDSSRDYATLAMYAGAKFFGVER